MFSEPLLIVPYIIKQTIAYSNKHKYVYANDNYSWGTTTSLFKHLTMCYIRILYENGMHRQMAC